MVRIPPDDVEQLLQELGVEPNDFNIMTVQELIGKIVVKTIKENEDEIKEST